MGSESLPTPTDLLSSMKSLLTFTSLLWMSIMLQTDVQEMICLFYSSSGSALKLLLMTTKRTKQTHGRINYSLAQNFHYIKIVTLPKFGFLNK